MDFNQLLNGDIQVEIQRKLPNMLRFLRRLNGELGGSSYGS